MSDMRLISSFLFIILYLHLLLYLHAFSKFLLYMIL